MVVFSAVNWLLNMVQSLLSTGLPGNSVSYLQTPTGWIASAEQAMTWVGLFVNIVALEQLAGLLIGWWTLTLTIRVVIWVYHIIQ